MLAVRAAPEDAALDARTRAWIDADDRHRRAWALAERAWIASGNTLVAQQPANRNRPTRRIAAIAACLLAVAVAPRVVENLRADAITRSGEIASSTLSDGSKVTLAGASAIDAALGPDTRRVALLRGAAYFDVHRDPDRPFVVTADGLTVTVLGTGFDVAVGDDTIAVAVANGTVAVAIGSSEAVLHAGDRLDYRKADHGFSVASVAPEDVALWRQDRLVVSRAPLGEVLDALTRRNGGYIAASDDLRARRVTGVFDLADPARALHALLAPHGATAHDIGGGIWWLRQPSAPAS
jgi:transmembrane sensor